MVNCRKKTWDDFYERPDSLESPIYQVLQSKGNFNHMLSCIDKAGYKSTLSSAGYWTLFAPTDEAFQTYFTTSGISGVDKMDSATARQIVRYCLIYNSFNQSNLDDYQAPTGWQADIAFRRRTAYYDLFDTVNVAGNRMVTIAANRNGYYLSSDNNNKYITYFTTPYFTYAGLTAKDYNYFYPNTTFTGLNVMDATITGADIAAENGTIHIVDKVLITQPSIDKYLAAKTEYSVFRNLMERFLVNYTVNADATDRYNVLYGSADKVYAKLFSGSLAFSPNNENYLKQQDNDGQANCWTLFAPKNEPLVDYLKSVILEHYNNDTANLRLLPTQIITDFVNAHMFQTPVWPTKFSGASSFLNEDARFDASADIIDKKILSNGFFYGTSKVQNSDLFSTVYARPYLDPKYTLMTRLLNEELKSLITNRNMRYTVFMMSDKVLNELGFDYSTQTSSWVCNNLASLGYSDPKGALLRILNMSIVPKAREELTSVAGSGIAEGYGGEMIRYNNGQVFAAGNIDSSRFVNVVGSKVMTNGTVFYTDGLLYFSTKPVGKRIADLATDASSPYYNFYQYLQNSTLFTPATYAISGVALGFIGSFLIPDNAAIVAAVNAGLLPGTGTAPNKVPNFAPTDATEKDMVAKFIQYHIIKKAVIANGTNNAETGESLYRSLLTDKVGYVSIQDPGGDANLYFKDDNGRSAAINPAYSYILADRMVIHSLSNYLQYSN
ncbi:hypothetical protein FLA_0506 [Filimonas lacunae]|nr:hypothetical protein FLA_0506 [Filimonas lacunae]